MPSICDYPICCRNNGKNEFPHKKDTPLAGKWGDYNCDIPVQTLKTMFDFRA